MMDNEKIGLAEPNFDEIKDKLLRKLNVETNSKNHKLKESLLFQNFTFANMNIKNHLCFVNLNDDMFYDFCMPNNKYFEFYDKIAKANVGLIVTGGVYSEKGFMVKKSATSICTNCQDTILKHQELVNQVHLFGSKIFLQLKPIFGRGDDKHLFAGLFPFSASFNKFYHNAKLPTMRISDSKCNEIIENLKELTEFSIKANYDGIMINGDSFNILGELSSKDFNKRIFGYYSNIYDMPIKILKKITSLSKKVPVIYSLTINTFLSNIFKNNAKSINSVRNIDFKSTILSVFNFMKTLIENGVDAFVINFGTFESEFMGVYNDMQSDDLYYEYYANLQYYFQNLELKNKFGEKVSIIYRDNFTTLNKPANYIENNLIDFIDVTKQIHADEFYVKNLLNDLPSRPCIKCGFCNQSARQGCTKCLVNPELFGENKLENTTKNVAIVGAGTSGIICANYLSKRNIRIDLFDLNEILNKNGRICEIFNFDEYLKMFNDYIENELNNRLDSNKINLFLKTKFDVKQSKKYDAIIVATGFSEKFLNLNGSVLKNVKSIYDILLSKETFSDVEKVVIYARGELSIKLAIYLASSGKSVNIIFPNFDEIKKIYNDRYTYYFYILSNLKVKFYVDAKVKKINYDFVDMVVSNNHLKQNQLTLAMNLHSNIKYKYQPKLVSVDMDLFIYEPELKSNNKLFYDIVSSGYSGQVFMIGNALNVSNLSEIISSAYFVAKNL